MTSSETARIRVRVTPRSGRNEISGFSEGIYHLRVTAPPAEGEANRAVIELLAKALRAPKSSISVASGASSRIKTLEISGISQNDVEKKLSSAL